MGAHQQGSGLYQDTKSSLAKTIELKIMTEHQNFYQKNQIIKLYTEFEYTPMSNYMQGILYPHKTFSIHNS